MNNTNKLFRYCYGCDPEGFTETAIITPFISLERFKKYCDTDSVFKGRIYSGFTGKNNGNKITVICCGVGDRLMGDAVLLLKDTPVKKIIFVGACGGLKDCGIGDLILGESAFDGEGFSRYYAKTFSMEKIFETGQFIPADSGYHDKFSGFLDKRLRENINLKRGDIFTIGSLMAEYPENLQKIEEKGFRAIDMELSAVYCATRVAELKGTGLLFVSDLPLEKPLWERLSSQEKTDYDETIEELIRLSLEFGSENDPALIEERNRT